MSWSGLIKFFTGFTLAIAFLFFAGVNVTRHFITKLTAPPPRPVFPNDTPTLTPSTQPVTATNSTANTAPEATPDASTAVRSPAPLPAGAYEARVTEPIGLIVRQEPSRDAERVDGVEYDESLTVLETSPDGEWQKVQLSGSEVEGWIKSGNVEPITE